MSLESLQEWLLAEGISADLNAVTVRMVRDELGSTVEAPPDSDLDVDWPRLLLAGSVLARSESRVNQEAALRIATAAVTLGKEPSTRDAGGVLLEKLANFRALRLANSRDFVGEDLDGRLGVALRLEVQRREIESSVLVESSGKWLQVNEFQQRFWKQATENRWLSASAPTASGKTFLVLQWLIEELKVRKVSVAVYLAPTRALVSEIEESLRSLVGASTQIEISSLPLGASYKRARDSGRKLVLVFTQERLHLLANVLGEGFVVDLLIVDEAHKIGDNQRGVILQDAVERTTRINPNLKAVFISPATQNPGELLADAPPQADSGVVDSDSPTVLQNVISATQISGNPREWMLSIAHPTSPLVVGRLRLSSTPSSAKKKLAFIAAALGRNGGVLVYANGAAEAEDVAALISQLVPTPEVADEELAQLAELAQKGVHPQFALAGLVEHGIAFHFGNMPSLLRLEIERLFRLGKIRFLVCTSTLIEGVNLSCRTIVLRGPRKGKGNPMEPHDFWNLAGRAGRWGNEFQGNIVCIDSDDTTAWPAGVPARARFVITRESDVVLGDGKELASYLLNRRRMKGEPLEKKERFEQVGAYLLSTYMRLGSVRSAPLSKRHTATSLEQIDAALETLSTNIEITPDIAAKHPGVSAVGLQQLLEFFRAYEGDVGNLLPANVASRDSYDRFVTIMRRVNEHLYPAFDPDSRTRLYALIVVEWLQGFSLARIIQKNIEWHREVKRAFQLPALIRETMGYVEQIARFRAPKYLAAYIDVLHLYLAEIGRGDLIDSTLDIGTQLEFGVSSRTLLSLMEIGLSRMSAVALFEVIASDELSKDECLEWISERLMNLEQINIPAVVAREVRACAERARPFL